MNFFLILIITLSNSILLVKSDHLLNGWTFSDATHSKYQVFPNSPSNFNVAKTFCESKNSSLVVIDSVTEFIWIKDFVNKNSDKNTWVKKCEFLGLIFVNIRNIRARGFTRNIFLFPI